MTQAEKTKEAPRRPRKRARKVRIARVPSTPRPFERFAARVARLSGRPLTFSAAVALILLWAVSGPLFGFSDTWQLVVNTSTTIITFLMVFLIQHTQNRDSLAIQIKLAELILVAKGVGDDIAIAEERSEEYLEALHETLHKHRGR